ncbi:MAG: SpoIVB peptidase [Acutalibacteraceae bacterium]
MKFLKALKFICIAVVTSLLALMVYGFYAVPDELHKLTNEEISVNRLFTVTYEDKSGTSSWKEYSKSGSYTVKISLFNAIPIKDSTVTVGKRQYVVVSGSIFGLRIYTDGVLIVGTQEVETQNGKVNPAENAGIKKGDRIISINGEKVNSCDKVAQILSNTGYQSFTVVIRRKNKDMTVTLVPAYSVSEQKLRAGLWIKDSAAGIGTLTFYDKETGMFAGLGHAVCDADTGEILPMAYGDTVKAEICGCYKGKSGQAGELCGTFSSQTTGLLLKNNALGVYGTFLTEKCDGNLTPIALENEVKTGKAEIISTVDESGPQKFEINIVKVDKSDTEHRNMIIEITDKRLLNITGGIVQGMSGSPILQNGMLVGAVTHVFVNDPKKGYAVFAADMMEEVVSTKQQAAS